MTQGSVTIDATINIQSPEKGDTCEQPLEAYGQYSCQFEPAITCEAVQQTAAASKEATVVILAKDSTWSAVFGPLSPGVYTITVALKSADAVAVTSSVQDIHVT